ncbi:MAG: hypothetical protein IJ359_02685 [Erysipelotrichaceae bacterium]|nr:hypothetical protein [Erysipelotrichaceae bacterium]
MIKLFHSSKMCEENVKKSRDCLYRIYSAICQKCGSYNFIMDDLSVAFSGSKDYPKLKLEICMQKYEGKDYLYASVDDEVSWQQWDFDNLSDFEDSIVKYIANRVNRTVKVVTDANKNGIRLMAFYLDASGDWICFEDEYLNNKWLYRLIDSSEVITTYRLEEE